jgi:hypothetical protein
METFIGQYYMEDLSICDLVLDVFNNEPNKKPGCVGVEAKVKDDSKKSTDVHYDTHQLGILAPYIGELQKACDKYSADYEWCNKYSAWNIDEGVNIQHYKPNEGYFTWHTERTCYKYPIGARHLVFMTYLNDVTDGGETEFYYQKLKIQPRKGLTLIWPADWTHTHRGVTSPTQDKYIITGWFDYME